MLLALAFAASFSLLLFWSAATLLPRKRYQFVCFVAAIAVAIFVGHKFIVLISVFSRFMRRYDNADVAFTMQFIAISLADSNDLPRFLAVSYNSDVAFTMQFIAISRADSNDLPRFLAVSLISFISLVEMSQCNNMPMLMTLIAPREVTCFVSGW